MNCIKWFSGALLILLTAFCIFQNACSFFPLASNGYKRNFIDTSNNPPMVDGVELGIGRNDGIKRIYTTREWESSSGYEYSFTDDGWHVSNTFKATAYYSSPVITDFKNNGFATLYLGGWKNQGVISVQFDNRWLKPEFLPGSSGKGNILAMKAGNGRNDGTTRLYAAYWSDSGLMEFSWTGLNYVSKQIFNKSIGRFDIGQGQNDGINRIYAVERGGRDLHEFTWNGKTFTDQVIFTGNAISNGSVHVADGRGDQKMRIYVWAGGLFELSYNHGTWSSLTLDNANHERYYINAGSIRNDKKPSVYVSVKKKGLYEYSWSEKLKKYDVDAITGATGGCCFGDGRGDGKTRLYVARGTKKNFTKAAIVEIWEE